ncbi:MAG: hypothetical protein ACOC83_05930 [Gemmatimonadota bacterium]
MSTELLLVRHGEGRGRIPGYWDHALDHVARHRSDLSDRIRLHQTGETPGPSGRFAAVVFWLGDPLEERYPKCFEEALELSDLAPRVVNPPRALSNTIKSRQARLWRKAGVPTPASTPFRSRRELRRKAPSVDYPVLVRPDRLHTDDRLRICRTADEVLALPDDRIAYPGALTSFVDVRRGYRSVLPDTLWARCYHKKRAFVLGDRVVPGHLYFSEEPVVRASNSTLSFHARVRDTVRRWTSDVPRWDRRLGLSPGLQRLVPVVGRARRSVDRELGFTRSAPERPELMREAARALGLGFVALDYSVLADGSMVFWEANPYPWATPWRYGILPRRRELRGRNDRVFSALARFFEELLEAGSATGRREEDAPAEM